MTDADSEFCGVIYSPVGGTPNMNVDPSLLGESGNVDVQSAGWGGAIAAVLLAVGAVISKLWKRAFSQNRVKGKDALAALWDLYNALKVEITVLKQRYDEREAVHDEEIAECRREHLNAERRSSLSDRRYAAAYERIKYHEELFRAKGMEVRPWTPDESALHASLSDVELHGPPAIPTEEGDS